VLNQREFTEAGSPSIGKTAHWTKLEGNVAARMKKQGKSNRVWTGSKQKKASLFFLLQSYNLSLVLPIGRIKKRTASKEIFGLQGPSLVSQNRVVNGVYICVCGGD
jgi:hypothetical protein